ncbi:MAG: hypothetical protein J5808_04540 [Paludibacteraceae bacterium]|nr:hypothetical protein [Paludibacteraceae bacterium]
MKKILFTVMALALLVGASSCKKEMEGKYAPKEKIQSVYQERTVCNNDSVIQQEPKFKSEEWTWENNVLDRITYFDQYAYENEEGDGMETELVQLYVQLFKYDGDGRLSKSEILGMASMKAEYEYDGKYLKTMAIYDEGDMLVTYQFNHEGSKITSFDLTLGDELVDKNKNAMQQLERVNPLRFVMEVEPASKVMAATKSCAKRSAKVGSKANPVVHFDMEWSGDNVSKIWANYMGATMQYNFNYDNKNNPFYNLFEMVAMVNEGFVPFLPLSKNNVTGIAETYIEDGESDTYSLAYTYTYNNKDYPTSKKEGDDYGEYRYETTYYYEYK